MEGIARVHGTAPNKKTPLLRDPLLELIDRIDPTATAGLRDLALLLLGFAVGLRRSELTALTVEDLSPSSDGLRIRIARSKTDQQGRGHEQLVLYAEPPRPCPCPSPERSARGSIQPRSPVGRSFWLIAAGLVRFLAAFEAAENRLWRIGVAVAARDLRHRHRR